MNGEELTACLNRQIDEALADGLRPAEVHLHALTAIKMVIGLSTQITGVPLRFRDIEMVLGDYPYDCFFLTFERPYYKSTVYFGHDLSGSRAVHSIKLDIT